MKKILFSFFCLALVVVSSCVKDTTPGPADYPTDVGLIITTKCAISGCHNEASKEGAGGVASDTWVHLFEGGNGGAVVIPYRPDQSWLMFYINTDTNRGPALTPTMPYKAPQLTDAEYSTFRNWIAQGAPNKDGTIPFSGDASRKKFYVSNQGCDVVTVFDINQMVAMRYIDVGISSQIEVPHQIRVSPDGQYWYVIFAADILGANTVMQKFRTADDQLVGNIVIGDGYWNTMAISPDGKEAYVVSWDANGKIAHVDLDNMSLISTWSGGSLFEWPHGIAAAPDFQTLYVTAQNGNFIYKIDVTDPSNPQKIVLVPGQSANSNPATYDPHEIMFSPDHSKYFVTCQSSNEVRVMDAATDTLMKVIPVGITPLEMSMSLTHPYLFVTCQEDPSSSPKTKGSVYVINYNTLDVVTHLQDGLYQPHGIAVDDADGFVVVPSRNINPDGPAPHHLGACGGRNGFVKVIDLNTLQFRANYRPEVSVDPYSTAVR